MCELWMNIDFALKNKMKQIITNHYFEHWMNVEMETQQERKKKSFLYLRIEVKGNLWKNIEVNVESGQRVYENQRAKNG